MRKLMVVLGVLFLTGGIAYAQQSVLVKWDPPTHRIQGDCNTLGTPLTQAEVDSLEYTLSYRAKGQTEWTNIDLTEPEHRLSLSGYSITYQFATGARFPGGEIVCPTNIVEFTTKPDVSPPGQCSDPVITGE